MEVTMAKKFRFLSGSSLKLIAILTMFIDHIGAALIEPFLIGGFVSDSDTYRFWFQTDMILRTIGRMAFPIFCFLLVEGFFHSKNRKNYCIRLFLFALISELPFDLAFDGQWVAWEHQNVFFTLLAGFVLMWIWQQFRGKPCLQLPALLLLAGIAEFILHSDYGYKGVLLIFILYIFHRKPLWMTLTGALSLLWEAPAILAFIPIHLYNQKRGLPMKYFFYFFYPLHLLLFCGIRFLFLKI